MNDQIFTPGTTRRGVPVSFTRCRPAVRLTHSLLLTAYRQCQAYFNHFTISGKVGRLPYMRMPTR